jgi:hypothetical protein
MEGKIGALSVSHVITAARVVQVRGAAGSQFVMVWNGGSAAA